MKILVTGGTGFLASHLIRALRSEGHTVSVLTRAQLKSDAFTFRFHSNDDPEIERAVADAEIIIHTAAQLHGPREEMLRSNVALTKRLVDLSVKHRLKQFVYISSENVTQGNTDVYSDTKRLAEQEVNRIPGALVIRPTVIYGPNDTKYITRLINIINRFPIVPVLGNGKARFQFVYVDDLVEVVRNGITNSITGTYTIAGPESVTYDELMYTLMKQMGVRKKLIHVPMWFLRIVANVLNVIFRMPPLTPTQLDNLAKDRVYDIAKNIATFRYKPTTMESGLTRLIQSIQQK